ncbi:hypothetical protein STRNTR1_0335 [Stenotrophomonas maltophilia]|nr:hypothetical protein STRNTR1_0335 [Stenotrophomonas maltophilia]
MTAVLSWWVPPLVGTPGSSSTHGVDLLKFHPRAAWIY